MKKVSQYCQFYEELANLLESEENVKKLHDHYKGLTVTFPVKLFSKEYELQYVKENYGNGKKTHEIARYLNLTERRIRQMVKEIREQ